MWTLRSLVDGGLGGLFLAAQIAAGALVVTGCYDEDGSAPFTTTSVSSGGSTSAGGTTAAGSSMAAGGMTASGGANTGGMATGGASTGGANTGGANTGGVGGGTGGALVEMVPDFSLVDMNSASPTAGQAVSPRDYKTKVSAWYFGHST